MIHKTVNSLNDLEDLVLGTPALDQVIGFNGNEWVNQDVVLPAGSGSGKVLYLDDDVIIATGAENDNEVVTLESSPQGGAEEEDDIVVSGNTVLHESYFYDVILNRSSIPGGTWIFDMWRKINNVSGSSEIIVSTNRVIETTGTLTTTGTGTTRTATITAGNPFIPSDYNTDDTKTSYLLTPKGLYKITSEILSSVVTIETPTGYVNESSVTYNVCRSLFTITTGSILETNYTAQAISTVQPEFAVTAGDRLMSLWFGKSSTTKTISFTHNGAERYSHFNTTLSTQHDELPGLSGGASNDRYHLTQVQNTEATREASGSQNGLISSSDFTTFSNKANKTSTVQTTKTADYVPVLSDAETTMPMDKATNMNVTIPSNASVPYLIGTTMLFLELGVGTITIVDTNITSIAPDGLVSAGAGRYLAANKIAIDTWTISVG